MLLAINIREDEGISPVFQLRDQLFLEGSGEKNIVLYGLDHIAADESDLFASEEHTAVFINGIIFPIKGERGISVGIGLQNLELQFIGDGLSLNA